MTHDQLDAFHAVATEGSFTRASARLHKSQPAISKLVRNLEQELGLGLFDRSAYRATLTDTGRLFLERTAALLESTAALRSFAAELAQEIEPLVRIAVEAVTPLEPVLAVLREAQERFPSVRIELRTERLAGALDALRDGSAELALAARIPGRVKSVEARRFCNVRIVPVAARKHPLARVSAPIAPALLRQHAQIVLADSAQRETASVNVLVGGLHWTVTDVAAKKEIISAGMGWGGLPEHVVARDLARGALVRLDVPEFDTEAMELFVLRRSDRPRGPVQAALWRAFSDPRLKRPQARVSRRKTDR
jgi:DNA-binding transcriptional LysR family regulator